MAPPPAELIDDVAGEIFIRLPPDEPEHLFRASLVCKPWFRLLTDPDFVRRYRAFHRPPPLLGYLKRYRDGDPDTGLVPTTSASLAPIPYFLEALDCHHGRVLLRADDNDWHLHLVVWDPVTGEEMRVPDFGWVLRFEQRNYSASVCCAVSGCDHLDCHGGPFRVVFVAGYNHGQAKARVYSSETGAWSAPVALGNDCAIYAQRMQRSLYFTPGRSAIIGDEIYFTIWKADAIVKYDMRKNCLSMINVPSLGEYNIALMEMEDGSLGFVYIRHSSFSLYVWSRKLNLEGAAEWELCKVVDLGKMIPFADSDDRPFVAGAAEGMGVIFVGTDFGLFMINVNSGLVKKISEAGIYFNILPFMSFYTPRTIVALPSLAKDSTDICCASLLRDVSKQRNPSS